MLVDVVKIDKIYRKIVRYLDAYKPTNFVVSKDPALNYLNFPDFRAVLSYNFVLS